MILGGTGFLGTVLTNNFLLEGYNVFILTRDTKVYSARQHHENLRYCDLGVLQDPNFYKENKISFIINTIANYGRDGEKKTEIIEANYCVPRKIFEMCLLS